MNKERLNYIRNQMKWITDYEESKLNGVEVALEYLQREGIQVSDEMANIVKYVQDDIFRRSFGTSRRYSTSEVMYETMLYILKSTPKLRLELDETSEIIMATALCTGNDSWTEKNPEGFIRTHEVVIILMREYLEEQEGNGLRTGTVINKLHSMKRDDFETEYKLLNGICDEWRQLPGNVGDKVLRIFIGHRDFGLKNYLTK